MYRLILFSGIIFSISLFAGAQDEFDPFAIGSGGGGDADAEVEVELVSEVTSIAPGEPFTVALKFEHQPGWHTYWVNSGDIEQGITVRWELPDGFVAGELRFPTPKKYTRDYFGSPKTNYSYSGENYVLAEITPPASLQVGGEIEITAEALWQHCDAESCVQGEATLPLTLPVAGTSMAEPANQQIFESYRSTKLPQPIRGWSASAYTNPQGIQVVIAPDGGDANPDPGELYFFPAALNLIDGQKEQKLVKEGDRFVLQMKYHPEMEGAPPAVLAGILTASKGWLAGEAGPSAFAVDLELISGQPPVGRDSGLGERSLLAILAAALIGGLILNLMPCVFPVIGLKIMGFVNQAGEDRKKVTIHGLIFALGVLVSFWVLSALFFILREQGEKIGWGFQLQNPWFVYGLILVMFVLALNMYGVFEIGAGAAGLGSNLTGRSGMTGTFFSGVLATVVATPCSAPFLGTALGAVATLPAVPFFATFTCIALGLALPYIILSIFPALVQKLPKPGPWMESFKQGMSFLLFATAAYLYWALSAQVDNSLYTGISLAVIGMALWIFGRWCTPVHAKPTRVRAGAISAVLLAIAVWMGKPSVDPLVWEPWSPARVAELREQDTPVYIDFTARWCATCQTNKAAYKSKAVQKLIADRGVVLLKASWDKPNPAIKEAIEGYGKGAIPVNVLYLPGEDEPEILPELLTGGVVENYLEGLPSS
ncbi:MAG: protein-disulfide reductase DsbD family protein [Verrucomicrobiales bacterium]